jgi:hypothetical protein
MLLPEASMRGMQWGLAGENSSRSPKGFGIVANPPLRSSNDSYINFEESPVIKIVAIRTAGIILLIIIAHYPR